jgi:hypothetical protein
MFIDHFVWVTTDLIQEIDRFHHLLGVRPQYGGKHQGKGTHNALVWLKDGCYLEIIAKDPDQLGIDPWIIGCRERSQGLIHWAWRPADIASAIAKCARRGWSFGPLQDGRRRNDETWIHWRLTDPDHNNGGFEPFLIEWSSGFHPTNDLWEYCHLQQVEWYHPRPADILFQSFLAPLEPVVFGFGPPSLTLTIDAPSGRFRLESDNPDPIRI